MDVIAWAVGLVAGIAIPLTAALALGFATSVAVRAYQFFLTDPQQWGAVMPEDLFGAIAMLLLTALFAWIGSIVRVRRISRTSVTP